VFDTSDQFLQRGTRNTSRSELGHEELVETSCCPASRAEMLKSLMAPLSMSRVAFVHRCIRCNKQRGLLPTAAGRHRDEVLVTTIQQRQAQRCIAAG